MLILYFLFDPIVITIMNMILVVLSAFFIFGTIRIYHAIVFTNYWKYFYSEKQKQEITDLIPSEVKDKFANHFFPGIIYYLIGILASITIIICASFNRA